ncbi:hypothetical protein DF185_06430 [Marinifilum breve]|uniref:Fibronectin type-III domain-containing protein n=1 Tax=Marinifilum breve TaxID=2184082 RepID=A0A2V4A4J0_9BACT|nr:hypothetical protein [Marinifilum breve]PXY02280.1 hypothetical protein DF185_06430 [Marinifilum breve]
MKKLSFIAFLLLILISSCDNKDDNANEFLGGDGQIVATILNNGNEVNKGIKVITDPYTNELTTDAFGQVHFKGLKTGTYDVYSYIPKYGSGKTIVKLNDDLQRIDIDIIPGLLAEPYVFISSPQLYAGFSTDEEITFKARVLDNNTSIDDLKLQWSSNIDGDLELFSKDEEGYVVMKTSSLSKGKHYIKIEATNNLGITSGDSIIINTLAPKSIDLEVEKLADHSAKLKWSNLDHEVVKMELYRSIPGQYNSELVTSITNFSSNEFIDTKVPFAEKLSYYAVLYNKENYERTSNWVETTGTPTFLNSIQQAELHPSKPIIYMLSDNKITAVNYEDYTVVDELSLNGSIGYFHIGNNGFGNELYIPSSDGWLYIYDLDNLNEKEKINVGVAVECVISNNKGLLFASVSPSPWWEQPLRSYSRETLEYIDGSGDFDDTRLRLLPSGNEIIEITTSITPIDMDYYKFDESGKFTLHKEDRYHGDHPLDANIFKVSNVNNVIITSREGALYHANSSMEFIGTLPRGNDTYNDFEFNSNETKIFAGINDKKQIDIFNYSSLSRIDNFKTKGYPVFILRKDNKLVIVSSGNSYSNSYYYSSHGDIGIETIDL